MSDAPDELTGPDLAAGIALADLADGGMIGGHAHGKPVLIARIGDEVHAIGSRCTHYGGALADGRLDGHTVRCPWHLACFDVRTGEATCAPALDPVARWDVEIRNGRVHVARERGRADGATPIAERRPLASPASIVIVGAGAAGNAAAELLRREGYAGPITLVGADPSVPYDRPNLSKDYLAGEAPEEWIPLRDEAFYARHRIDLRRETRVASLDVAGRTVVLDDGERIAFDRLLLATGADPIRLADTPGADLPHVHYLRTRADSRALIGAAEHSRRAVVIGASFIGLEVAASLRKRGLDVHVVAPEALPLARILGDTLGAHVRALHESHGVVFHLGHTAARIEAARVVLDDGSSLDADLVVVGVGVRPALALAEAAGLAVDRGVLVDAHLETSAPGIYAAGDIARLPDARTGERIRMEHWAVAERQGQTAARNMLGAAERHTAAPFFWSAHYDRTFGYIGHAERWDDIAIDGDLEAGDASAVFRLGGRILAVVTLGRDALGLAVAEAMEHGDDDDVERAVARFTS